MPVLTLSPRLRLFEDRDSRRERGLCGGSDRRILLLQQPLRLRVPGHQFAVEAGPVGPELLPEACALQRRAELLQQPLMERRIVEKPSPGARDALPDLAGRRAEPPARRPRSRQG